MSSPETLPTKGIYTLVILLRARVHIELHRLGSFGLQKGYYAYTGSALGNGATGLRKRVTRHLRKRKREHWHIDFLLTKTNARVTSIVAAEGSTVKECHVNMAIKNLKETTVPILGFGASDCKENCESHLLYLGQQNAQQKIVDSIGQLLGHEKISMLDLRSNVDSET